MGSFSRKLKRKQTNAFKKTFKKTMKEFKRMVKCEMCERVPEAGEKIDNWQMVQKGDSLSLKCVDCLDLEIGGTTDV